MKFKEYLEKANQLAKEYPECLEYQCIHSSDDEGNGFFEVWGYPCIGNYEGINFIIDCGDNDGMKNNAVCIN